MRSPFSNRQQLIIALILDGMPDSLIASQLSVSVPNIKTSLSRIYARLRISGPNSRVKLVRLFFKRPQRFGIPSPSHHSRCPMCGCRKG